MHLGTLQYQTGVMLGAALVITPVVLVSGTTLQPPAGGDWLWMAAFVLLPGAIGHTVMVWAHRYVDVSVSSLIVVAQPVVSALAAAVVLDESLGALQLVGGAIVLATIAAVVRSHRPLEPELLPTE